MHVPGMHVHTLTPCMCTSRLLALASPCTPCACCVCGQRGCRPDASLRELVNCVKETCEEARQPNVRLSLAFVYTDGKGEVHMRNVGVLHTTKRGRDDEKILRTLRFQTGDFLDCAVLTAL